MTAQTCPNCQKTHDVSVFVTGQRILCSCGIRFEVNRRASHPPTTTPARTPKEPEHTPMPMPDSAEAEEAGAATFVHAHPRPSLPGLELKEILGRGGMGEVWRATQLSLKREVAVKLLPPRLAKDPEFVARFEKEANALSQLSHPNIIQIIDRGVVGEHYYFVMEFVNGRSLRELMTAKGVAASDALKIVAQICLAIDYAHEQQIIHRDLKPENILVDARGHVKVADFGLAGMHGPTDEQHLTATAVAMGTINYMAPEQRKDAKSVDGRADLYSLGVILYELLTGELPLGRFKLPGERLPGIDPKIDELVAKSLETDPAARYQRASEVGRALEALIGSSVLPALTGGPGLSQRGQSTVPGRKSVLTRGLHGLRTGLMVIGALGVLGTGARLFFGRRDGGPTKAVEIPLPNGGEVVVEARRGQHPAVAVNTVPLPPNTEDQLYSAVEVTPGADGLTHLSLSFDGGDEQLNCHAGQWTLHDSKLFCTQAGNLVTGKHLKLVPRAYLAHRYFSADDFSAEVDVTLQALEPAIAPPASEQRFAELAFRIRDTQVSLFAVPNRGMRLAWRYFTPDGTEVEEDSAQDVGKLMADEVEVPPDGTTFHLKLALQKKKGGVELAAYANGQRFVRKLLPGLEGETGKVALGCRNLHCTFDSLAIAGLERPRPRPPSAEANAHDP